MESSIKFIVASSLIALAVGCGGGGGGGGGGVDTNNPPDNTITAAELLATGDDVVPESADLTLVENQLILSPQDKLTLYGKLAIGGSQP